MGVAIFLIGKKVLQDRQHAIVAVFHLPQCFLIPLIESAGHVACDHEHSAPKGEVEPAGIKRQLDLAIESYRVHENQQNYQNYTGQSSESGVSSAKVIGGKQCRKKIEDQCHALRRDQKIQHRRNDD